MSQPANAFGNTDEALNKLISAMGSKSHTRSIVKQLLTQEGANQLMELAQSGADAVSNGMSQEEQNKIYDENLLKINKFGETATSLIDIDQLTIQWMMKFKNYFSDDELSQLADYILEQKIEPNTEEQQEFLKSELGKKYIKSQKKISELTLTTIQSEVNKAIQQAKQADGITL